MTERVTNATLYVPAGSTVGKRVRWNDPLPGGSFYLVSDPSPVTGNIVGAAFVPLKVPAKRGRR